MLTATKTAGLGVFQLRNTNFFLYPKEESTSVSQSEYTSEVDSIVLNYLRSQSAHPTLYDWWEVVNERVFDSALHPVPLIVGISKYGRNAGWSLATDHVGIQQCVWLDEDQDVWKKVMVHEMCHQADRQAGLDYEPGARLPNIHNTQVWCDRINSVMEKIGEKRFATPFKKTNTGEVLPRNEVPEGTEMLSYSELARWEPLTLDFFA